MKKLKKEYQPKLINEELKKRITKEERIVQDKIHDSGVQTKEVLGM